MNLDAPIQDVIENLFNIPAKNGEIVPFKLNNVQSHFMQNKALRNDILKARQFGISSLILAWFLVECMNKFTRAVLIAHDSDATRKLLQRGRFMLQMMNGPKPQLSKDSEQELGFPKTGSTFFIGTAGSRKFGRSDTITHLHCSEYAFWPDAKTMSAGLFQAVPHKTGVVVRESTANGYGTYHHKQVLRALKGMSRFRLIFYPWYIFEEYQSSTPLTGDYDEKELELKKRFNLSDARLQWRREKLDELEGDENLFCQEYPATIEEAFLVSGGTLFPRVPWEMSPSWVKARELSRKLGGSLSLLATHLDLSKSCGAFGEKCGALPGLHYILGADSSGGTGNDFSSIQVICLETLEQVAVFRSNTISPPDFAEVICQIGRAFNNAFLVPELNSHGISVVAVVRKREPYKSNRDLIFRSKNIPKKTIDRKTRVESSGYRTSRTSKYLMIGTLMNMLNTLTIYDEATVDQLHGFGELGGGELGNIETNNDDDVMALALACEGVLKMQLRFPAQAEKPAAIAKEIPATTVDFDDIFSRIHTPAGGWLHLFNNSREANPHVNSSRN